MASPSPVKERLIRERVRALATMYLTRRNDLSVREIQDDLGYDLLVRLTGRRKRGLRQFGVELRGLPDSASEVYGDKVLRQTLENVKSFAPFPFPVCVFLFTVQEDQGWYFWAAEPVVTGDGRPSLQLPDTPDCRPLDDSQLEDIVLRVDRWFDAFYANLSARE